CHTGDHNGARLPHRNVTHTPPKIKSNHHQQRGAEPNHTIADSRSEPFPGKHTRVAQSYSDWGGEECAEQIYGSKEPTHALPGRRRAHSHRLAPPKHNSAGRPRATPNTRVAGAAALPRKRWAARVTSPSQTVVCET